MKLVSNTFHFWSESEALLLVGKFLNLNLRSFLFINWGLPGTWEGLLHVLRL